MATQRQRSAVTRLKLLNATIDCLAEYGWAGTSTTIIAKRAGLSRGAQLYHFPTKKQLVLSAVDHLLTERDAEFRLKYADIADAGLTDAVDLLWSMVSSRTFDAWLELVVASRTDAKLRRPVANLTRRFAARVETTFRVLFPEFARVPGTIGPFMTLALLEGLALDRMVLGDDPRIRTTIERFKIFAIDAIKVPI